jgi:hypothetical protein
MDARNTSVLTVKLELLPRPEKEEVVGSEVAVVTIQSQRDPRVRIVDNTLSSSSLVANPILVELCSVHMPYGFSGEFDKHMKGLRDSLVSAFSYHSLTFRSSFDLREETAEEFAARTKTHGEDQAERFDIENYLSRAGGDSAVARRPPVDLSSVPLASLSLHPGDGV